VCSDRLRQAYTAVIGGQYAGVPCPQPGPVECRGPNRERVAAGGPDRSPALMHKPGGLKSVAPTAPTAAKPGGVKKRAASRVSLGRSGESAMGPSRGPETCRGAAFCSHRVQRSVDRSLGRSGDEAVAGLRRGLDMSQASAAGAPLLARWLSADDDELLRSSGRAAPP